MKKKYSIKINITKQHICQKKKIVENHKLIAFISQKILPLYTLHSLELILDTITNKTQKWNLGKYKKKNNREQRN